MASIILTVISLLLVVKVSAADENSPKLSLIASAMTNASRQYAVNVFSQAIPVCANSRPPAKPASATGAKGTHMYTLNNRFMTVTTSSIPAYQNGEHPDRASNQCNHTAGEPCRSFRFSRLLQGLLHVIEDRIDRLLLFIR